jgi:glycosyltransferase involved in cell wall biosynthesis
VVVLAGKWLKKPVVVKTASSGMTSDIVQLRRFPFGKLQLKYLLENMNILVVVSRASGREYINLGFSDKRIVYIPNGVRLSSIRKNEYGHARRILAIGRLSREKGMDILLRAWKELIEKNGDLKLLICGDGPEKAHLKSVADSWSLSDSVEFLGNVERVSPYLEQGDVFVLPSRTEGMSNALLEAMSHGLPCIATNVGGDSDLLCGVETDLIIDKGGFVIGHGGILVNPEDVRGLVAALSRTIEDKVLRERLGNQARELVKEFYSLEQVTDKYTSLYNSLIGNRVR